MRIPRIYTPQPLAAQQSLLLEAHASRHVLMVLRLKTGAPLVLFDGSGREFEARLDGAENHHARVSVAAEHAVCSESPLHITLVQGISRGERMDFTLQKAVELGVAEIIPVLTERSVVHLDAKQAMRKQQHWQQLVIGACEQSGRVHMPPVGTPRPLNEVLSEPASAELSLLLHPTADAKLSELAAPAHNQVRLLVGPEGGLSGTEIAAAQHAGFISVQLGPRVLRTETAALVALSLLQARWGDLV
ncbi:MAG: 16S rRNA (uracil(1498)-N(3))-methyltransferase [Gammaproteobacteria bacterium]|nr:16S rRNA (uracil(1498)-N(3))-methyltransferase [Gammaproteobacteria bacterium]MDE2070208.1 16S rRNA (uracil(1498)-N(3))-methyltransferase [Gammaproteobacteria bacterium]